ncbi:hypothetical protein [Microbacterium sp. PI-1]|nr:hypothetical protein [Microbacterium sp. PI-1]
MSTEMIATDHRYNAEAVYPEGGAKEGGLVAYWLSKIMKACRLG